MSCIGIIYIKSGEAFEKLDDWNNILVREKFVAKFNPDNKELKCVIGNYLLDKEIHCGLTNCNQKHKKGFIVLTSTGEETNIGNICGKKIFGDINFSNLSKAYKGNLNVFQAKITIQEAKQFLYKNYERLEKIRKQEKGADWLYHRLMDINNVNKVGTFARDELSKMARIGDGNVYVYRKATERELEIMKSHGNSRVQGVIKEVIGKINYLSAFKSAQELKNLVINDILATLKSIEKIKFDNQIDDKNLLSLAKKINNIETSFSTLNNKIEETRKFLTKDNLTPLIEKMKLEIDMPERSKNIMIFSHFLKTLD